MLPIVRSSTESGYLQNLLIVPDRVCSLDIIHPFCEVIQIPESLRVFCNHVTSDAGWRL